MASLNVRRKNGTVVSLSGSAYTNDIDGTKKLYVRTGTRPGQIEAYGIATVKTATDYSPMAFDVNGEVGYIGRKETHYTYSTNERVDFTEVELVNTQTNPTIGGNLVSTVSSPKNYVVHMMTTFSNSYSNTTTLVNTEPLPLTEYRTATSSSAYNTVIHMSTVFSNSSTNSGEYVNTQPNAALNATLTKTASAPYNLVVNRSTTFSKNGDPTSGYASAQPSGFPNPDTVTSKESINGAYKTSSYIKKSQKVYTYKSTVYHTYNEDTNITQSSNATNADYKCNATVGDYSYEGAFGAYNRINADNAKVYLADKYSCRYSWSFGYKDGKDYFVGSGIHYPNSGYNLGNQDGRNELWREKYNNAASYPRDVNYTISANSYSQYDPYGNGGSGTVRYSYHSYYRTSYSMNFSNYDYNNLYAWYYETYTTWYYRSSAPVTSTKKTVLQVNKTQNTAIGDEKTWWTAPDSYNNDTKNDSWHGVENVLKTVTATSSSYATTIQNFTVASVKDENSYDTQAIANVTSSSLQINSTLSRTTYFSKKVSSTSTTYATQTTKSVLDEIRESAKSTYSAQVNATSSYTINFGKKMSYTYSTKENYVQMPVMDFNSVSALSTYSKQVNSTSSYSVKFSKNISQTFSTKSKSYSTINNSTIEEPDRLIEKVTHNFI